MKRVLVYEPSETFANFVRYVLSRLGYKVTHVCHDDQIMSSITKVMPELILAEANNGTALCKRLKNERMLASIPVAIISIDGTVEARTEAYDAGCVDYLTKPVNARALHELMERHLPFSHKRHNLRARMHTNAEVSDGERTEKMKTLSIGEGGMYACTRQPFAVGTNLKISLLLPSLKGALELKGEVIYLSNDHEPALAKGMGIKFVGMDSNMVTLLHHYMESYLSNYLPDAHYHNGTT